MSAAVAGTSPTAVAAGDGERPRVLVKEKIGDSGVALLREHFDVELGIDWDDEQLAQRIGEFEGIVIRSATKLTAELLERADPHEGRRAGRCGRRQRRRGGGHAPRDRRRQRARIERRDRGRAHDGAAAGAGPQHSPGVRLARRRPLGPFEVLRCRAVREDARRARLRAHRPARGRSVPARFGMRVVAFDPFVSAERYPRARRREGRQPAGAVRERRLPHHPPAEDARHDRLPRRRRLRRDARRRARAERRPRRPDRRRRAQRRARQRQGRRRGDRRVREGAR